MIPILVWKCTAANHRDEVRVKLLAHEATLPGFNDSGAHNVNMAFHDGSLQALRQAVEYPDILPIEKAIYRLTKMPADWLGLDAGSLETGRRADVCIIDPTKLSSCLTEEPIEDYHPSLKGAFRFVSVLMVWSSMCSSMGKKYSAILLALCKTWGNADMVGC